MDLIPEVSRYYYLDLCSSEKHIMAGVKARITGTQDIPGMLF